MTATLTLTRTRAPACGDDTWRAEAACLGHDPELWYPPSYGHGHRTDRSPWDVVGCKVCDPIRICRTCPVNRACLDYALTSEPTAPSGRAGIWAGTTPSQRSALYRRKWRK